MKLNTKLKKVYAIYNFGILVDFAYTYKDAKEQARESVGEKWEDYYQIYRCDIELKNLKLK